MRADNLITVLWSVVALGTVTLCFAGYANGKFDHDPATFKAWTTLASGPFIAASSLLFRQDREYFVMTLRNVAALAANWLALIAYVWTVGVMFGSHVIGGVGIAQAMQGTLVTLSVISGIATISFGTISYGAAKPTGTV